MLTVVVVFTILAMGIAVMNPVVEQSTANTDDGDLVQTHAELSGPGEWVRIDDYSGVNETVVNSRGYALRLTGANDSYVQSTQGVNIATDTSWTVSTWARVNASSQNETMTAVSANGRALIVYNGTSDQWVGWYYNEGQRDSYLVNVSAPDQPANLTNVQLVANETHLTIYQNNTRGSVANITVENTAAQPNETQNWHGTLEETRTFDDGLGSTTRQELIDTPLAAQPNLNRTTRIMYDEPYAQTQLLLLAPGQLETYNASFVSGFEGKELQEGRFAATGSDYSWNEEGPQIKPLSGGEVENAPVVYVDYTQRKLSALELVPAWTSALGLAALVPIIVILGFIVVKLQQSSR